MSPTQSDLFGARRETWTSCRVLLWPIYERLRFTGLAELPLSEEPVSLKISDLVQRFDAGEIRLPLMQRDYIWKPKKVVRLLDSLYHRWPIGSFYVWQTRDAPTRARVGKVLPRRLDNFYGFLLDGQQRLTSLSLAIKDDAETELQHRGFFDLELEQFYLGHMTKTITKRIEAGDPLLVPLSDIISSSQDGERGLLKSVEHIIDILREQAKLDKNNRKEPSYRERLHKLGTMLMRNALCEEFTDDDEENAFELFSRLNKGGTSLSAGDVEAARLASAATKKIVEPMRIFVAEQEMRSLGISFVFLLRCLVTVHRGNCSFSKLPQKWADDSGEVESSWHRTAQALRVVVQFLRTEVGWTTRRWLPSTMALIPVVYLLAKTGKSSLRGKEAEFVRRYLLVAGLRGLFRGGPETTVNSYVNAIRTTNGDITRCARALFDRVPKNRLFKIRKEDVSNTSGMYSPLMQVYLAYLYHKDAKSWPSARSLRDVLQQSLVGDPLAVHHIFPKKFMQDRDFPVDRLNTVANYAVLSQADNAELSDRDPFDVWRGMKPNQRECASLQLCFVSSENFLRRDAYEEFVEFRAAKLSEQLNEFLGLGSRPGGRSA
jgi:hypothetical protein